jgi:hypothetical protein
MTIQRRYEPAEAALDELVEVLYRLLVDTPELSDPAESAPPEAPCFFTQPE